MIISIFEYNDILPVCHIGKIKNMDIEYNKAYQISFQIPINGS